MRGERLTVVVSCRNRLARFGFDLIEWAIKRTGGQVVVLNKIDTSPSAELVADLMAIITVFSFRLHGLRSYRRALKSDLAEADAATDPDFAQLGG
jgi:predicted site-specific integrase-resolvase